MNSKSLGRVGENYACNHLVSEGFKIIKRNFRGKSFEIDIIALKDDILKFVEVKTRTGFDIGEHYKSVTKFKALKIRKGVTQFILRNPTFIDFNWEFVVAVVLINPYTKSPKVVIYNYLD